MLIESLFRLYGLAERSGLLRTRAGEAAFSRAYFLYKSLVEDPFAGLVRTSPELFRDGEILDVGANIGYTASVFARALSGGRRVWAFEPESTNFARLQRNIRRAHVTEKVIPIRAAVGESRGEVELRINPAHPGDHRVLTESLSSGGAIERVPLLTIDGFLAEKQISGPIRFVKIDVQGYELAVLRGMPLLLDREPALSVAVEIAPDMLAEMGFGIDELLAAFLDRGYRPHLIARRGLEAIDPTRILESLPKRGYMDVVWRRES